LTPRTDLAPLWLAITSLKLTIACLAALMVLVLACTVAQVQLGTWAAVDLYMRSFFVWAGVPGSALRIPIFPGGATVGLVLLVNLVAAQARRLELSWGKSGLWLAHAGLVLLVLGEFVTSAFQRDAQMSIEVGQTVNFVESTRDLELAVIDTTDPAFDDVYSIPASRVARGGAVPVPGTPITLTVKRFFPNADLTNRGPADPPPLATAGVGAMVNAVERPPATRDNEGNLAAAWVEPVAAGRSYGTWLVSNGLGAPQSFTHEGRTYVLKMRHRREYLPYAVTLEKFSHDVYAGTDIPKNFSSLVRISNPSRREDREVLIYMNQPLRYQGKTFYQASFGKNDTLSVLQVVANPGWLIPYVSCVLVALGLIVHFAITLRRSARRREASAASPEGAVA
jgi:hypothetical protein